VRFFGQQFDVFSEYTTMVDLKTPLVFPQFVVGGGWATALILSNPADVTTEGRVDFFSPHGNPMAVTMNGVTSNSFKDSLGPGKAYVLRPELDKGGHKQ
jgi:hypothetical protein